MRSTVKMHRHVWDRRGRLDRGTIRTCTTCGVRQVKLPQTSGGLSWQTPAWLSNHEGRK